MIVVRHRYIACRGSNRNGGKSIAIGKALGHMKYIQHRPVQDRKKGGREIFNERDDVAAGELRERTKKPERQGEKNKREEIDWKGDRYSKEDNHERLKGLAEKLRDSDERLAFDDYQKLRQWIENQDRERFSGALEKQIELADSQERARTQAEQKSAQEAQVIDLLQEELMGNPVLGLFMTEAAITANIVGAIPLDDRNHGYLRDMIGELEEKKRWKKQIRSGYPGRELATKKRSTSLNKE